MKKKFAKIMKTKTRKGRQKGINWKKKKREKRRIIIKEGRSKEIKVKEEEFYKP